MGRWRVIDPYCVIENHKDIGSMHMNYRRYLLHQGRIASMLLSLIALVSCDIAELNFHGAEMEVPVNVTVLDLQDVPTRSSVGGQADILAFEGAMNNMTLFQFTPDGTLYHSYYFPSLQGRLSVQGRKGVRYHFMAVMNMGDVTGWLDENATEAVLDSMTYEYGSLPDRLPGCPMSCLDAGVTMSDREPVLNLVFTRLMSRFDLKIDCSHLGHGSFAVTSLQLCQAPSSVQPLAPVSRAVSAEDVADGDYALRNDLAALNSGGTVPFYILENAQGTLLSGNTDPWAKVPSSVGAPAETCTYIELKGIYTDRTGRMQAEHTYRMYLGENSTTNFDVIRGTYHDMTLILSDDGFLRATWKAERHILSDSRTLSFWPDQYSVRYGDTQVVSLSGSDGCSFSLSDNLLSAGVSFDLAAMSLSQTKKLSSDVTGTLTAVSWDRVLTATCAVTALRYRPEFTLWCIYDYQWDYDEDQTGEVTENTLTEWLRFEAVTSDGQRLPCRFRIPGIPACAQYAEKVELVTTGVNRGPGPADMPERELLPESLRGYTLYVIVDGEESCPSWDTVTIRR